MEMAMSLAMQMVLLIPLNDICTLPSCATIHLLQDLGPDRKAEGWDIIVILPDRQRLKPQDLVGLITSKRSFAFLGTHPHWGR